ncbi:hypothetical protein NG796_00510 [Laspinema sp. A4]|uniref:hypothetical protein n=1 Tax=Laspinema sp. D2d TaxID=2953686 RepID=UPI0021BA60C9|nr:hypothetical protein [Laspinema sp. D2d]MCT7981766.1 hypothetical protein [Laspinema sp. D2d]
MYRVSRDVGYLDPQRDEDLAIASPTLLTPRVYHFLSLHRISSNQGLEVDPVGRTLIVVLAY